jgi:hypothetical protein
LTLAYDKSASGDRCLLQVDGEKVLATGDIAKIGMGNPRLSSAIRILGDLALIEEGANGLTRLTKDGKALLARELTMAP